MKQYKDRQTKQKKTVGKFLYCKYGVCFHGITVRFETILSSVQRRRSMETMSSGSVAVVGPEV